MYFVYQKILFKYSSTSIDTILLFPNNKTLSYKETVSFEQAYPDTTKVEFDGQVSVKLGGGGVNGVIEFTLKIGLQSDFKFTDPV